MADLALNVIPAGADGTRPARRGYDNAWFGWVPLPSRSSLSWPDGAAVAVAVVINLGAIEWEACGPGPMPPPGGRGIGIHPDFPRMSHREFGHRVGIFRLLDIATRLRIPVAAAVDVLTAEHYSALVARLLPAAEEILAAGLSASRPITSLMTLTEETHYVASSLERLEAALGNRPSGWISPENSQSDQSPAVLAAAGVNYLADWSNDEQPYQVLGVRNRMWAFPLSWELSDLNAMFTRGVSPEGYRVSILEAADVLAGDGATGSGRVLGLHLHPWVSGQAFRAGAVEAALAGLRDDPRVWMTTPGRIVEWCQQSA